MTADARYVCGSCASCQQTVSDSFVMRLISEYRWSGPTDLHIYNLDAVPLIHIISNHVDTDKLTSANDGAFTSS